MRSGDFTSFAAGMCFHVMLDIWMNGWGYELSEPVTITRDGVSRFTGLTQELTIKYRR